jgi:hypothetical protein
MRCQCCDRALNDYESTLKSAVTGKYLDTCNKCLKDLGIKTIGRSDLSAYEDADKEDCCVDYETDGVEE